MKKNHHRIPDSETEAEAEANNRQMGRRNFLKFGAASLAASGISSANATDVLLPKNSESVSGDKAQIITSKVDILVVGGGSAGTIAAIQAGRTGASTMVMERASYLGGMTTRGGVCYPGLFDAWGKQIIDGVCWELNAHSHAKERNFHRYIYTLTHQCQFVPAV